MNSKFLRDMRADVYLKHVRSIIGFSQEKLASVTEMSITTIRNIEQGRSSGYEITWYKLRKFLLAKKEIQLANQIIIN